jgi:hypothetical protein
LDDVASHYCAKIVFQNLTTTTTTTTTTKQKPTPSPFPVMQSNEYNDLSLTHSDIEGDLHVDHLPVDPSAHSDPLTHVVPVVSDVVGVEQLYNRASKQKMLLVLFAIGLKLSDDSDENLINLDEEPWKSQASRSIKPSTKMMKEEVVRRSKNQAILPTPKPAYWAANKLQEWLENNPINNITDVEFLRKETKRLTDILTIGALDEENDGNSGTNWVGNLPHLRLILCLTEDDCRASFLRRNVVKTRTEIDEINSSVRPPTAYELISDRWNSPDFNPIAEPSDCHEDFRFAIDCSFDKVKLLSGSNLFLY